MSSSDLGPRPRSRSRWTFALKTAIAAAGFAACMGHVGDADRTGDRGAPAGANGSGGPSDPGSGSTTEGGVTPTSACAGQPMPLSAPRVWRLTTAQRKNTLLDAFNFAGTSIDSYPADSRADISENADVADTLDVGDLLTTYYNTTAEEVSANVVTHSSDFLGCAVADLGTGTCLQDFLTKFGLKAWRRPLASDEITGLQGLYNTVVMESGAELGFTMVVQALILSPNFSFRTELGTSSSGQTPLTDYEVASALSYMLWDSPPDQALYDAAAAGMLHDPASIGAQVRRMFASSTRAPAALSSFVAQWLHTDGLLTVKKDPTLFPMWSAAVAQDLANEAQQFVSSVAFDPSSDHTFAALLTANFGFVSSATAGLYGVAAPAAGAGLVKTNFDPSQRSGLLTLASWVAAVSNAGDTALPARGNFVRGALLCDATPPPPAAFTFDPSQITPNMTGRQKFTVHTKSSTCGACHNLFDGIGFALEDYDPIGRFRTTDQGQTIDPTGSVPLPSGQTLQFANAVDMMKEVASSPDFARCYASQYLRYATGRVSGEVSDCELETLAAAVGSAGNTIDSLPAAIAALPTFTQRQN
jgi:hypothetical protein